MTGIMEGYVDLKWCALWTATQNIADARHASGCVVVVLSTFQ